MSLPHLAYPGLPLGPSSLYIPGPGTHLHTASSTIHASLAGQPILTTPPSKDSKPTISIPRLLPSPTHTPVLSEKVSNVNTLPSVGSVVLGRVTRVRGRGVEVGIAVVYPVGVDWGALAGEGGTVGGGQEGGCVCADEWAAVIRKEDVRATEKEKVVTAEGFRVGDVVRGVVISLGDQSNYYLSTARNELGVIMAKSEAGHTMHPISWNEFRDPVTGLTEGRKVAKPF
ncbi:hypothetical protein N7G274_000129 [Stereocaulon virgatum]|uniref:Exosome complex component CSL4 C-terminal domain-containing protein n=1 Tax=Stereocaulon virgatum TaxID=373712 RepID=A0ABR4AXM5_9LECA